jgi:hypothetical protein
MTNSDGKASPGQPFAAPKAEIWNSMIDAGNAFRNGRLSSDTPDRTRPRSTDVIRLKNNCGEDRARGEILRIDDSQKAITDLSDEHIWLIGVAPNETGYFGVLKEPIASGEVGQVQVSGCCMAMVNIIDADHTRAKSVAADYVLDSADDGPIEILYAPSGTGELECVVRFGGSGTSTTSDPAESNYGVVTVEITGESDCAGETFDDLGFHVFLATITSRPFPHVEEMRKERAGELTIFDPTGCMLDLLYDPEDFTGATAFVSLMYGGEIYDKKFNFKPGAITNYVTVLTTDTYETLRPSDDCKPFGWVGGERVAHDDSMGPVVPNGITTFQVLLPEKGLYEIEIVFGDISEATNNQIEVLDGDTLLDTFTETSESGQEWTETHQYDFKSANRPILKIRLDNAADRNTRIVSLTVLQIDPPTQWEVINRCCIAKDTE